MWTFCACPAWWWIPHPHTSSQTQAYGVWLKLLTDGRGKKGAFFLTFASDGSKLDRYFRTLDAFVRTFGRRPDGLQQKKVRLKKKRPLHVCIVWANLPRNICHQNWSMHSHVRNWVLRPTLMRAKMKEQSTPKNQSKEDRNRGIKHINENQCFEHLFSCTFNYPK